MASQHEMWNSKLGNKYSKAQIEKSDREYHAYLKKLRTQKANQHCCDCDAVDGALWTVVNIGCFVCVRCASLHRGVGTHISKVKGLTGTYLWGPDEVSRMIGNAKVREIFGGQTHSPGPNAGDDVVREFILRRYDEKKWFNKAKYDTMMDTIEQPGYLESVLCGSSSCGGQQGGSVGHSQRSGPEGSNVAACNGARELTSQDLIAERFPDLLDFAAQPTLCGAEMDPKSHQKGAGSGEHISGGHPISTYPNLPADFDPFLTAVLPAKKQQADPFELFLQTGTRNSKAGVAKPFPGDVPDSFFDNW